MPKSFSIYEQLTGVKVNDATLAQLDFTKNTFIDSDSIEYWKGVITVSKILEGSRTYPHGLSVPESGSIVSSTASAFQIKPGGTQVWKVYAISASNAGAGTTTFTVSLGDGSGSAKLGTVSVAAGAEEALTLSAPLEITPTLFLVASSDDDVTLKVAYQTVGL